ncbi:MAG: leucine-rich repeat protein [[Clostridium] fimetarium]|nr:leucine-rich repeat protein [Alistipes timonensis]MCM1406049.1 leucine-rich repeat protein [[Clostridium] fimetarium]
MKKILLLFAALLTLNVTAYAQNPNGIPCFQNGDWLYAINPDANHEVTVVNYTGEEGCDATELTIPSYVTYKGSRYLVTILGEYLFSRYDIEGNDVYTHWWKHDTYTKLEKVAIPNTVTEIGRNVFSGCTGLASVTIPNSVTEIGSDAFSGCTGLASVTIPNSVTEIGSGAFYGCTGLASVTIPNSVTEIGGLAFADCTGLTSVTIPNSVTEIGGSAFADCTGLTSVTIPNSVTEIRYNAFGGCTGLTSVTIPSSVTKIANNPFPKCTSLQEIVVEDGNSNYTVVDGILYNSERTQLISYPAGKEGAFDIPNSVTEIEFYAFEGCSGLTSVTIPNSVTEIGYNAFQGCTGLTSVTIPNSVTEIQFKAFEGCSGLTSVTIPNSVTRIWNYVFSGCTGLTTIYALPTTPPLCGYNVFKNVPETAVVYIPKGSFKGYFVADGWDHFTDFREMGALDITLSESSISIEEGETATLTATVTKDDDVTVKSETWSTSNPEVATVADGVVVAVGEGTATITYTVVDGYGVPHAESCDVKVSSVSGIKNINANESDAPAEFFNLNGVRINAEALTPGLYIKRQGGKSAKVLVK